MILIFLGPPGSGKGTQAKRLSAEHGWPHLSTGDMLRTAISIGSRVGLEAKSFIDQGALVPDSVVINLIAERISTMDCAHGFILDGFPRNIAQAHALDAMLGSRGRSIGRVVLFEITEPFLIKRLSGRRTCSGCNTMYHIEASPPKREEVCDLCGKALIHRSDDQPEVIHKRLEIYSKETEPLAGFYRIEGKLQSIDATLSPLEVSQQLSILLAEERSEL